MIRRMVQGVPEHLLEYLGRFLEGNSLKAALQRSPMRGTHTSPAGLFQQWVGYAIQLEGSGAVDAGAAHAAGLFAAFVAAPGKLVGNA